MKRSLVAALLLGALVLSACLQQSTPAPTMPPVKPTGVVKEFVLNLSIKGFSPANPAVYAVNLGDTARFVVTATDEKHNFVIDEYGVKREIEKGQTVTVEFLADKPGVNIPLYDDLPGHRYQENAQLVVK